MNRARAVGTHVGAWLPLSPSRSRSSRGIAVIEKLDFLVRFWELRARHATTGQPLSAPEQVELLSLMQLVTSEFRLPSAGPAARTRDALPAQLIGDGTIFAIEVRAISAAALIASSEGRVPVGSSVILRATDAVGGVEYALPCTVAWVHPGTLHTMALVVDGVPTRKGFSSPADVHVGATLWMGPHERLVG
jgi:hypothetical protein